MAININTMQTQYDMTDKELRKLLKTCGWMLRKDGNEYEVYPKGKRGDLSYFTNDRQDALNTAKNEAKYDRDLFLRAMNGQVGSGMTYRP